MFSVTEFNTYIPANIHSGLSTPLKLKSHPAHSLSQGFYNKITYSNKRKNIHSDRHKPIQNKRIIHPVIKRIIKHTVKYNLALP